MRYFETDGQTLVFRAEGETLWIEPWGKDCLRVRAALMNEIEDTRYALLDPESADDVEISCEDARAFIRCGDITARVEVDDWHHWARIAYYNGKSELMLREVSSGGALGIKARHFTPLPGGDFKLCASFDANGGERLYGMGQYQQDGLDLKGCVLELAQRNSQCSVPFYMSSRGYGFVWHNPAVGEAAFGKNKTVWKAEETRQLDYLIFTGNTPAELSFKYARLTGFAPMMPEHGLGFWQCKLRYESQDEILRVAREYKKRGLPLDVIVCDFFHWPHLGDYRFDPEFFPDPKGMCEELRKMNVTLMVSVWPQIGLDSENYEEMRQQGLLMRSNLGEQISMHFGGDSIFYDATNPRARDYVWKKCEKNYYDQGVRAFWLDCAEPELSTYDFGAYRYQMGSHLRVGNLYPQAYARNFYEGMRAKGQESPVNLLRCAWLGSQRFGALVWSGDIRSDFKTFRRQLCAGLNMGLAGIPWWTTDIGGFLDGNPDDPDFRELLVRWFQWGAYCPVMRLHGDRVPGTPVYARDGSERVHKGADNEIWSYGEEAYPILKKYLFVREGMRDYIRGIMQKAHTAGTPVMRAMFYEFPDDPACESLEDQYMFGERYLVAPVLSLGARERSVYLPKGQWRNVDTNETLQGGKTVTAPAPLDVMPVFERL